MSDQHTNPFDDERHQFFALRNAAGQYSLWPTFSAVPEGWTIMFGPDTRSSCLDHIEQHWTDLRPAAE